jgi:pectate lyase
MFGRDHSNIITARFGRNHVSHNYYPNSTRTLVQNTQKSKVYSQAFLIVRFEPERFGKS